MLAGVGRWPIPCCDANGLLPGRGAPPALVEAADTVTEMGMTKHAFKAGIKAQKGVEF